jgi:Na+-transporting methylmalonyl-CoA/oxaloacetate decarboxylase gamma subunit
METGIFILFSVIVILIFFWQYISNFSSRFSAPFVGTEPKIVKRMLDIAELKKGDVLYDLGSGDGRIVLTAALRDIKAVGVELDPFKVLYSRLFIKVLRLNRFARVIRGNFFEKDISEATVVTLFLLHDTNQKLADKFKKELKKGARIVSYSFAFEGWKPEKTYLNNDSVWGPIYLYKV